MERISAENVNSEEPEFEEGGVCEDAIYLSSYLCTDAERLRILKLLRLAVI